MDKKLLKEEIERIHSITYGKKVVLDEGLFNDILKYFGLSKSEKDKKFDDPKKADLIKGSIDDLFSTLKSIDKPIFQGDDNKQKEIEAVQIGLSLLMDNPLSKAGIDGSFGPETAEAIKKFKIQNNLEKIPDEKPKEKSEKNKTKEKNEELNEGVRSWFRSLLNKLSGNEEEKESITPELVKVILNKLQNKELTDKEIESFVDKPTLTGGGNLFTDIDLSTTDGQENYKKIATTFINKRNPSAGITGDMIKNGAVMAFERYQKYIPPELSLGQLAAEGGLSKDSKDIPIFTNNPYNIGNTDEAVRLKKYKYFPTKQDGVNAYFKLIATNYLVKGKTANDLINNFVNKNGNAYASGGEYEKLVASVAKEVKKISDQTV